MSSKQTKARQAAKENASDRRDIRSMFPGKPLLSSGVGVKPTTSNSINTLSHQKLTTKATASPLSAAVKNGENAPRSSSPSFRKASKPPVAPLGSSAAANRDTDAAARHILPNRNKSTSKTTDSKSKTSTNPPQQPLRHQNKSEPEHSVPAANDENITNISKSPRIIDQSLSEENHTHSKTNDASSTTPIASKLTPSLSSEIRNGDASDANSSNADHVVWATSPALAKLKAGPSTGPAHSEAEIKELFAALNCNRPNAIDTSPLGASKRSSTPNHSPLPRAATQMLKTTADCLSPKGNAALVSFRQRAFKRSLSDGNLALASQKRQRGEYGEWSGIFNSDGLVDFAEVLQKAMYDVSGRYRRDYEISGPQTVSNDEGAGGPKDNGRQLGDVSSNLNSEQYDSNSQFIKSKICRESVGKENLPPLSVQPASPANTVRPRHSSLPPTRLNVSADLSNTVEAPSSKAPIHAIAQAKKFKRYLVLEVQDRDYVYLGESRAPEKVLRVWDDEGKAEAFIHLREDWFDTLVEVGSFIHYIGELKPEENYKYIVNNEKNMIVLQPDLLMTSTSVSDAGCTRRAVLQERVRGTDPRAAEPLFGTMLHELFQQALIRGSFEVARIRADIPRIISNNLEGLWAARETEVSAKERLEKALSAYIEWSKKFMGQTPKTDALLIDHRKRAPPSKTVSIMRILDIEENIWSPMVGLKGKVDASVQLKIRDGSGPLSTVIAPLEVKTGRAYHAPSHMAQTSMYTMLMRDRYDVTISAGLLYYVQTGEMLHVGPAWEEVRQLIISRNRMVGHLTSNGALPEVIKNANTCNKCFVRDTCILYHRAAEAGTAESFGLADAFMAKTVHLTQSHLAFFEKWERLITLEEKSSDKYRAEIWNMSSEDRQKAGRAFSRMRVDPMFSQRQEKQKHGAIASRHRYRLIRNPPSSSRSSHSELQSLLNSQISVGDTVVVSSEDGLQIGLAVGVVTALAPESIVISADRPLTGPPQRMAHEFDSRIHQNFVGTLTNKTCPQTLFRIDKDELSTAMGLVRGNLVLMFGEGEKASHLRRLIVDLEPPRFTATSNTKISTQLPDFGSGLNVDQHKAVQKVKSAQDYALILGMPGTGKTTTISILIRTLVAEGKSILLTSYTHTAVDNVLLKLKQDGVEFVRLGNTDKVHPGVVEYTPSNQQVATTCLGVSHGLFSRRTFDYCIVDEASQLTLPVCLGPLRFAKKFVLVGDHYQLPPLVKHQEARDNGLAVSLFRRLSEAHPSAVTYLEHQYRMCSDITLLSNTLIYNHRLRCGTPAVADAMLQISGFLDGMHAVHQQSHLAVHSGACEGHMCWIRGILDPVRRVVFVDTDSVPAPDSKRGESTQNDTEAVLVKHTVESLIASSVEEGEIGVISPYRSQLKVLTHILLNRPGVEVHTVDKFQGRDKECVIVSLVRSNSNQNIGDLLRDWRRINVAFTRAKHKLIIFGSGSTLAATDLFTAFLDLVEQKQWVYKLPPKAHQMHYFPQPTKSPNDTKRPSVAFLGTKSSSALTALRKRSPIMGDVVANYR
ncbi:hypothetical protein SeMB42_g07481 [Synchytrium endobioticum]|uniref:DNA replication ATP-dependent helicase/nuclease n=1 Tax=Synchytrium endobioticum TaxID=286115 RepID=A0A507C7G3_9FUNG|nr:hypothetical protein SeMB42_g07481 [Synchytrium endobioticum]